MNKRITEAFAKGKAFIPFVTCGDPSLDVTEKIVYAMEEAGADLIELGIPFSDPTAEGPVIQGANLRALSGGVTTDKVFDMVEKIRKNSSIPMVFMTYANVVFSYGIERFCKRAAEVGMDGMILPDVPFEEKEEFSFLCQSGDVFFRLNLRCRIQSPEFNQLWQNFINTECVELFKPFIRVIRNIGISVFCHYVSNIFKYFQ